MYLLPTLLFYSNLFFVTEPVFISEHTTQGRFAGALLKISEKFSPKLNVFSYVISQAGLIFWKVLKPHCMVLKTHYRSSFTWKAIICTAKVYFVNNRKAWNFLKWERYVKIKILIWHKVGEMLTK